MRGIFCPSVKIGFRLIYCLYPIDLNVISPWLDEIRHNHSVSLFIYSLFIGTIGFSLNTLHISIPRVVDISIFRSYTFVKTNVAGDTQAKIYVVWFRLNPINYIVNI